MKVSVTKKNRAQPTTVKIKGDWEAAIGMAIRKPKPAEGWPMPKDATASLSTADTSAKPRRKKPSHRSK